MNKEDLDDLAHEIAEDDSKSIIESTVLREAEECGTTWYDLRSLTPGDPGAWAVDRAVMYLEGAGILKRSASEPNLVGWDEDYVEDCAK